MGPRRSVPRSRPSPPRPAMKPATRCLLEPTVSHRRERFFGLARVRRSRRSTNLAAVRPAAFAWALSLLLAITGLGSGADEGGAPRVWTSIDGRSVSGRLAGLERGQPVVIDEGGRRLRLPLALLSEADREWLAAWRSARSAIEAQAPLDPAARSGRVAQAPVKLDKVSDEADPVHRYAGPVYDIEIDQGLPPAVLENLATMAEATVRLVDGLPLALPPRGERRYLARLFATREAFETEGGTPGQAGWFHTGALGRPGALLVPFESLGIGAAPSGGAGVSDPGHVLRHEIAHQATADVMPLIPLWLREGVAEYVARTPYRDGVFELGERGLAASLRQRHEEMRRIGAETDASGQAVRSRTQVTLPELMAREASGWGELEIVEQHRLYFTAQLLTSWYLHLEGDGEGRVLRALFDLASEASLFLMTQGQEGAWPEEAGPIEGRLRPAAVAALADPFLRQGRSWEEIDARYLAEVQSRWGLRLADER